MSESFPPGEYVPTSSAVEGIQVFMPAPEVDEDYREVVYFKCPQCGGKTGYSVTDGGLVCTFCGYYEPPKKPIVGKGAQEFEFTLETMQRSARGWGQTRKEIVCQNCGAHTSVPAGVITNTCPFCASSRLIQREAPQDVLRPRFLVPFGVEASVCPQLARDRLSDSWMMPGAFRRVARFTKFIGVQLPFWTLDATIRASWRAQVGHTRTVRYRSGGEWKTRTETVWKWESGNVTQDVDDMLVCGTSHVSQLLLERINQYDLRRLVPYEPSYLAGFHAQAYDVLLETAWESGRHRMREQARLACLSQASTSQIRDFGMHLGFDNETWRYILLPMYIAVYRYKDQTYQVMVNGQTGAVSGQRPVDWAKVWLVVAFILAPGVMLSLVGLLTLLFSGIGLLLGGLGLVLLVVGLLIDYRIIIQAQGMDDA